MPALSTKGNSRHGFVRFSGACQIHRPGFPKRAPPAVWYVVHTRTWGGFSVIALVPRYLHAQNGGCVFRPTTRSRPRLGLLVVRCGDLALSQKNMPFYAFFTCSQNSKITPFSFISRDRGFSAIFEQAELRDIPMGPHGPPNAKGTAQIAPEIAISENQAIWVILIIIFGENMPFLATFF